MYWIGPVIGSEDQPTVQPSQPSEQPEPDIKEWLAEILGVSKIEVNETDATDEAPARTYYYFFFDQLIDHNDASKGTFKQRVVLRYNNKDAVNVLHTQGYNTSVMPEFLNVPSLADIMNANLIEIEYHYFGASLPESFVNMEFNYFYSSQASEDYHAIVTALKDSGRFQGKWVATGTSKGGIAAGLYAYFNSKKGYNDMDLYVPFCAPFCEAVDAVI